MVKKKLVERLIEDGAALLLRMDHAGIRVDQMFWVLLPDEGYWRLIIASPIVEHEGPLSSYARIHGLLTKREEAGLVLEDISVMSPESPELSRFLHVVEQSGRVAPGRAWLEFEDGVVYRWEYTYAAATISLDLSAEQLTRIWENERRKLNEPALLIETASDTISLRFHPQHGPRSKDDYTAVRRAFQLAVHRYYPNCAFSWKVTPTH